MPSPTSYRSNSSFTALLSIVQFVPSAFTILHSYIHFNKYSLATKSWLSAVRTLATDMSSLVNLWNVECEMPAPSTKRRPGANVSPSPPLLPLPAATL